MDHSGTRQPGQRRGDLGFGPRPIVQLTIGTKQAQGRLGRLPSRLGLLIPLERRLRLLPGDAGRPGRAPRVAALLSRPGRPLGWPPRPAPRVRSTRFQRSLQDPPGFPLGVEDIQPLLQRYRLRRVWRGDPARIAAMPAWSPEPASQTTRRNAAPGLQFAEPGRTLADCRPSSPGTRPCCAVRPRPGPAGGGRRSRRDNRSRPRSWRRGRAA